MAKLITWTNIYLLTGLFLPLIYCPFSGLSQMTKSVFFSPNLSWISQLKQAIWQLSMNSSVYRMKVYWWVGKSFLSQFLESNFKTGERNQSILQFTNFYSSWFKIIISELLLPLSSVACKIKGIKNEKCIVVYVSK